MMLYNFTGIQPKGGLVSQITVLMMMFNFTILSVVLDLEELVNKIIIHIECRTCRSNCPT